MISVHECPLASSEGKERGGINVYTYELSKALARLDWSVDAFTRVQDDTNPRIVPVTENFRVIHLPNGPHAPLSKKEILTALPEFTANMTNFITSERLSYDIVHAHYYLSGMVARELISHRTIDAPFIMTFHTLGLLKNLVNQSSSKEDPPTRIPTEQELVTVSDSIVATSTNTRAYLASLYNGDESKISVIPPGVDTSLFYPKNKADAKTSIGTNADSLMILAVGRIDPVKGFDVLLYAMKMLLHTNTHLTKKICLCIIGGDVGEKQSRWSAELNKLNTLRSMLGLETSVKFVAALPQPMLVNYYNAADVLVMPSHYESFGMVALEALACGTPVIATDVTGISPMVKEFPKGRVVSANNPILLAQELEHVLAHPVSTPFDTKEQLKKFDWNHIAEEVQHVYDSVRSSPRHKVLA